MAIVRLASSKLKESQSFGVRKSVSAGAEMAAPLVSQVHEEALMHSDLIGKIAKARRYAQEPERILLDNLKARFRGGNNDHTIALSDDHWSCDCSFFRMWQTCAHVMAFQQIFNPMLSPVAREASGPSALEEEMVGAMG
ncbi:MAG TPA: hypothetical protein VGJ87_20765 [Roseiflexaceae bacterium]|jgi:hypothetical protein